MRRTIMWVCASVGLAGSAGLAATPRIEHTPVTVGVQGQALMVRARVTAQGPAVRAVSLHYSTSRDAAPFSVPMQSTTANTFIGTIPGGILGSVGSLTYYISAEDASGTTAETPWYTVRVDGAAGESEDSGRPRWVKPVLIGGGVAAAAGAAAIIIDSQRSEKSVGGGTSDAAGTYRGTSTQCEALADAVPVCQTRLISIVVQEDGVIRSNDLRPGVAMESRLSGSSFVLTARVDDPSGSGEIRYVGSVSGGRAFGTIEGTSGTGTNTVTYSGVFSADKQP